MGRWGPADMHGGLSDSVVFNREDEEEIGRDGVDFFEDGVTVELGSLHDRIVSCGPDRPILHELNFVEFLVFDTWIDPEFVHDPNWIYDVD